MGRRRGSTSGQRWETVSDAPLEPVSFVLVGRSFTVDEGASGEVILATFSSPDSAADAASFSAVVDWGAGGAGGAARVEGESGSFRVVGAPAHDEGEYRAAVTVTGPDGLAATTEDAVSVDDAALTTFPVGLITVAAGDVASAQVVARFQDANPDATPGDFTAWVDWGTGAGPVPGTVTDEDGTFAVSVDEPGYALPGWYLVHTHIADEWAAADAYVTVVVHGYQGTMFIDGPDHDLPDTFPCPGRSSRSGESSSPSPRPASRR